MAALSPSDFSPGLGNLLLALLIVLYQSTLPYRISSLLSTILHHIHASLP